MRIYMLNIDISISQYNLNIQPHHSIQTDKDTIIYFHFVLPEKC